MGIYTRFKTFSLKRIIHCPCSFGSLLELFAWDIGHLAHNLLQKNDFPSMVISEPFLILKSICNFFSTGS